MTTTVEDSRKLGGTSATDVTLVVGDEEVSISNTHPLATEDIRTFDLLVEILDQLKIMNMHLTELSGEEFQEGDIL